MNKESLYKFVLILFGAALFITCALKILDNDQSEKINASLMQTDMIIEQLATMDKKKPQMSLVPNNINFSDLNGSCTLVQSNTMFGSSSNLWWILFLTIPTLLWSYLRPRVINIRE